MPSEQRPSLEQKLKQTCKSLGFQASAVAVCVNVRKDQSERCFKEIDRTTISNWQNYWKALLLSQNEKNTEWWRTMSKWHMSIALILC